MITPPKAGLDIPESSPMRFTPLIVLLVSLVGCLRYTPSFREIQTDRAKDSAQVLEIGDEQDFERYEQTLSDKLYRLVSQRSYLLGNTSSSTTYPVGTGDLLGIEVFGFGNLSSQSTIAPDGSIGLPLVGRAVVAGKSIEEVQLDLTRHYRRYIRSPQVHVSLKGQQAHRVSVMGEVAKPGLYPLQRQGVLLTEILAEAGGRTQGAGSRILLLPAPRLVEDRPTPPQHLTLVKSPPLEDTGVEIDLETLTGQIDQRPLSIPLLPGDTIVVPEAGTYEVDGEVAAPGSYKLASRTSVMGAIAAAQGFTYSAAVNNVEVIRDTGGGRKALVTVDLEQVGLRGGRDIRLRNGDLVRVPSEPQRFFKRQIVETINGLFNGVSVNRRMN